MKKEVTPELLKRLTEYLNERERGETTLLSFFYTEVFGRALKINCGSCISDAIHHLKTFINKTKPVMENFIWKGSDKATCIIKASGTYTEVGKHNCTDALAEFIESNPKYSHLVQRIKATPPVEKKSLEAKEVPPTLEVTILTSKEAKKEETEVKGKRGRPKLK